MLTLDEIKAAMTPEGGWTKETLAKWGVPWPPPKGWKAALIAGSSFTPKEISEINRDSVRAFLIAHPGCKQTEISSNLGLSLMAVSRHVAAIRKEWESEERP